jgi:hypothetical protein
VQIAAGGTLTASANSVYSKGFDMDDNTVRMGLTVKVPDNAAAADIVVQGGWTKDSTTNADWVDTALSATGLDNIHGQVGPAEGDGTIFAVWPFYRVKITSAGVASVSYRVAGFRG